MCGDSGRARSLSSSLACAHTSAGLRAMMPALPPVFLAALAVALHVFLLLLAYAVNAIHFAATAVVGSVTRPMAFPKTRAAAEGDAHVAALIIGRAKLTVLEAGFGVL